MGWRVFINGKDSGIFESDYEWASSYWHGRAQRTGYIIKLRREA